MSNKYRTARAIIVQDGQVLLFFRRRFDRKSERVIEYYSIPGGGIDTDESPEEAVVRELREEMGVEIRLERPIPLAHGVGERHEHFMYYATIISGEPRLAADSEEAAKMAAGNDEYEVRWVAVDGLESHMMHYYNSYLPLIVAVANGEIPAETIKLDDKSV